jgi:hypothetical protein
MSIILPQKSTLFAEWRHKKHNGNIAKDWKFYKNDSSKYYAQYKNGKYIHAGFVVEWNEKTNNPDLCIFWGCNEDRKWKKGWKHIFPVTQQKILIGTILSMKNIQEKKLDNIEDINHSCQREIIFTREPSFLNGKIEQCWEEHS